MATVPDYSRPTTPETIANGIATPRTPRNGFALTEYSANPSPPSEPNTSKTQSVIPEAFLLPNGYPDYLRLILTSRVYEVVQETPLTPAVNLSNRLECNVLLKREDLQPVFSFKLRGAYNKMAHLEPKERWRGVVACSAGNHAQGVAYSARKLKIPATIVMPSGTPDIKHKNVSRMGGSVILHGADFDAAKAEALSGANMNFDRLRFVAERAAIGENKEAILSVTIPESPGAFANLVSVIHPMAVTEFSYRYSSPDSAQILVGVELKAATRSRDLPDLIARLAAEGMTAHDLSQDELVKSHIRYLVGGRSDAAHEHMFMFAFPERGGALYKFLNTLQPGMNISLFHYRNYGGDVAKILAGIQCHEGESEKLTAFLKDIGYPYEEVTDSPSYNMFLRR
ncbi:hypothetical protein GGP41_010430 [Bipolaris sorokiniana]|uniref:threonine ammonia-lyase n=1 Tax=Cochliobolus sativus TaxID=45130 RepID=A0A8H5ZK45_COCSA|nr:hypothetical protein GGP41_010430 [Bipolaris sorokiniana]